EGAPRAALSDYSAASSIALRRAARVAKPELQSISRPSCGALGIRRNSTSLQPAMAAPDRKTAAGDHSHMRPKVTGMMTAAMWLMVKATPAVGAMPAGSAIFWKWVLIAIAMAKNAWSIT